MKKPADTEHLPSSLPLIHWAESYHDPDQFFLTGFLATDPFLVIRREKGPTLVAVNSMEVGRAKKEARPHAGRAEVRDLTRLAAKKGVAAAVAALLRREGARGARVLPGFPLGLARKLEAEGVELTIDSAGTAGRRRKNAADIAAVTEVQRSLEEAFALVKGILLASRARRGFLESRGVTLTAEALRAEVEEFLLSRGCECADTIVAPGRGAADPHWRGEGRIRPHEPVVVDIFPRDKATRFFSDMSRTFVKGKAAPAVAAMHRAVEQAQDAAFAALRVGSPLAEAHEAACGAFRKRGYGVPVDGVPPARGFLHGTGHGVGLAVHEEPSVSARGDALVPGDVLAPGDVITIEPGLYDRRVGGMRIEDIIAVTPDGRIHRLTDFPRELEIP
jgi:Xaa-Pro aminopeptidase